MPRGLLFGIIPTMTHTCIANCIPALRAEKKITQEELASAVGVSRQTIITVEKGNCIPSLLLASNIAKFFDKPVEEVFELDNLPKATHECA